ASIHPRFIGVHLWLINDCHKTARAGLVFAWQACKALRSFAALLMRRRLVVFVFLLLFAPLLSRAQFESFSNVPIAINAEQTRFEGGVAIAEGNVIIQYAETTIYCDYAEYNPDTRDVLVRGNVRIYRNPT